MVLIFIKKLNVYSYVNYNNTVLTYIFGVLKWPNTEKMNHLAEILFTSSRKQHPKSSIKRMYFEMKGSIF